MSYINPGNSGAGPVISSGFGVLGFGASAMHLMWVAITFFVVAGMVLAAAKFAPRVSLAFEGGRPHLAVNGRRRGMRHMK